MLRSRNNLTWRGRRAQYKVAGKSRLFIEKSWFNTSDVDC
jgi:hypothetical protein